MSYYRRPSCEPYHPLDPVRRDSLTTLRDGDGDLLVCVTCDDVLEVPWPDVRAYLDGTKYRECLDCAGDRRAAAPTPSDVRVRTERVLYGTPEAAVAARNPPINHAQEAPHG